MTQIQCKVIGFVAHNLMSAGAIILCKRLHFIALKIAKRGYNYLHLNIHIIS